jgi:hypothetical protein
VREKYYSFAEKVWLKRQANMAVHHLPVPDAPFCPTEVQLLQAAAEDIS